MPEFPVDVLGMAQVGVDPGAEAVVGKMYTKSVLGISQPHYRASDGAVTQLNAGSLTDGSVPYTSLTNKLNLNTKAAVLLQTAGQGIFDTAVDTVTVLANTTYLIRGMVALDAVSASSFGTNSLFSGTASYTSFDGSVYANIASTLAFNYPSTSSRTTRIISAVATQIAAPFGGFTQLKYFFKYNLIAVVNAGGTMIPSLSFSAAPAAGTLIRFASMEIIPLGSNTFTGQNWT